jgi:RNA polymerase sigma-70 factor (ECF subfamily)
MVPEDQLQELERLHRQSFSWSLVCCEGDRQEAEEVLQTVYLKVLDGRARFGGRSNLKTWLFAVIRRTAAGARRRAMTRRWLIDRWAGPAADPSPEPSPEERLRARQRTEWVQRALGVLSRRQRQVLELVFYHELTLREAAKILGVSIGTARAHYARGKSAVLKALSEVER